MSKRNPGIELYRCILMFGICLLHCLHSDDYGVWAESLLLPCVCGFAFISGWFGIRFTPSKVLRLYGIQLYCLAVMQIVSWAGGNGFYIQSILKGFCSFWFIHAYVLMMLLAPLVNHATDDRRSLRVMVPFLVAVFGWGFLGRFPIVNRFVPKPLDLDMYSGLTLLGVYAVARLVRIYRLDERLSVRQLAVCFLASAVLCSAGHLGFYNSPVAVVFIGSAFLMVIRLKIRNGGWINRFGPSMFSVYFFHLGSCFANVGLMIAIADKLDCVICRFPALLIGTVVVFLLCIAMDIPRRLLVCILKAPVDRVCCTIDGWYERRFG